MLKHLEKETNEEKQKLVKLKIDKIRDNNFNKGDIIFVLQNINKSTLDYLYKEADLIRKKYYDNKVFLRGLIEFSNYCNKGCLYCGISRNNKDIERYRLSKEDIMSCCSEGYKIGFRTFVLQSGEDPYYTDEILVDIIRTIKEKYSDSRVTISIGEKNKESYLKYYNAGADRYLLRHEAFSKELYESIHPSDMSYDNRIKCLKELKEIGFQTGCGFMVGLPNQTNEDLANDLMFIYEFQPEMCGIGPFIPHSDTVFKDEIGGNLSQVLIMVALTRLLAKETLLPATTALGTLNKLGRELAVKAGANVVMPNLSPIKKKKLYELYENKICLEDTSEMCRNCMDMKLKFYGYEVDMQKGDVYGFDKKGKVR